MIIELLQNKIIPWTVQTIGANNCDDLFLLHYGNDYYNSLLQNEQISKEQVLAGLTQLPHNTKANQKFYIGIFQNSKLLACMDYIEGYPDQSTVFIGLLMIDKKYQGRGIGSKIIQAFLESVNGNGYKKVRLACLQNNTKAKYFWLKQGFAEIEMETTGRQDVAVYQY